MFKMTKVHIIYTLLYSCRNFILSSSHDTAPLGVCLTDAQVTRSPRLCRDTDYQTHCAKTGKQPFFVLPLFAMTFPFQ